MTIAENLLKSLKKPDVLFNIGVGPRPHREAEIYKKLWPQIQIFGLEPNIEVFVDRVHDYPGQLYPWGVWRENCIKQFLIANRPGWSSLLQPDQKWLANTDLTFQNKLISCITLDELDKTLGYKSNIFLWMDIEGSELDALEGAKGLLQSQRVQYIDLEISHKTRRLNEPSESLISKYLQQYGFKKRCNSGNAKTFHNVLYELKT